ncbi:rhomboid family intramembrane serine protease [Modestobacter muralis]|uniref:Rhomboid family intramembrane serine protease n=1 Tax=Modestobacter muralis TaxID=1608614 RepID=A0A6P0H4J1_9ACTN|nr:rhomboid family intramembrane serine protease [Modestobacter muralis]NEK93814.1 rhomboid family intramembrane serine protease [Modestobacter muralis]NEN50581.1 rhomboid family intramembrane serine protease [Modestobacter muralis]
MNPASVGFQCPDDVRAGNAGIRQPRRTTGLRVAGRRFGPVTLTLIGVNVLVALATAVSAATQGVNPLRSFASPLQNAFATAPVVIDQGEWWRVVTSAFTHVSLVHLVFNMLALLVFGSELERQLGRGRYLTLYLVSALGGAAAIQLFAPPYQGVVGASAAIYGLLGGLGVLLLSRREDLRGLLTLLAINLVVSFLPGISWQGHLGGLVAGALVAAVMVLGRRNRPVVVGGTALLVVVLLVLVFGGLR